MPYLLALLVASLAWTLTHFADRLLDGPTLELAQDRDDAQSQIVYAVRNLSRAVVFKDMEARILIDIDGKTPHRCVDNPTLSIPAPLLFPYQEPGGPSPAQPECLPEGRGAIFHLPKLQPGTAVIMAMKTDGPVGTRFHLSSDEPYRLIDASWRTWAIRHELEILLVLIALWTLAIILYLIWLTRPEMRKS